jgi:hypothetical protein
MSDPYRTSIEIRLTPNGPVHVWQCDTCRGEATVAVESGAPWAPSDYDEACPDCTDGTVEDSDCLCALCEIELERMDAHPGEVIP